MSPPIWPERVCLFLSARSGLLSPSEHKRMHTLCLDPSASRMGWAVFSFLDNGLHPTEWGAITIGRGRQVTPSQRVTNMIEAVSGLCEQHQPHEAVIEIPSGRVMGHHGGRGHGLSLYGFACGVAVGAVHSIGIDITTVTPEKWTRGIPKETRRKHIEQTVPGYSRKGDSGADAADAIGIGQWWSIERLRRTDRNHQLGLMENPTDDQPTE